MKKKILMIVLLTTVLSLFIMITVNAQTRLYLSSATAPPVTLGFDPIWNTTTGAWQRAMSTAIDGSAMISKTSATGGIGVNVLIAQFVSPPLDAQTILNTGTFRVQNRRNSSVSNNNFPAWCIYVVSPTGTIRGYICNFFDAAATTTTLTNRGTNNAAATISTYQFTPGNISVTAGDYLVCELGGQSSSGSKTYTASFGSDNVTDLPENNTTTAANNPWIQLSQTLAFQTPPSVTNRGMPLNMLSN